MSRTEQEFGQCPDPRVDPVGGGAGGGAVVVAGERAHLVLELGEGADVVHPPLLVEGGHRLGAGDLAAARAQRLVGQVRKRAGQRRLTGTLLIGAGLGLALARRI